MNVGSRMPCHRERNAVPPGAQCRATGNRMPCHREHNAVPLFTGSGMPCLVEVAAPVLSQSQCEWAFHRAWNRERNAVPWASPNASKGGWFLGLCIPLRERNAVPHYRSRWRRWLLEGRRVTTTQSFSSISQPVIDVSLVTSRSSAVRKSLRKSPRR
jgi:hypothetical protein